MKQNRQLQAILAAIDVLVLEFEKYDDCLRFPLIDEGECSSFSIEEKQQLQRMMLYMTETIIKKIDMLLGKKPIIVDPLINTTPPLDPFFLRQTEVFENDK